VSTAATAIVTGKLAQWLCEQRFEQLPAEVKRKALDVVYDSVGGMVACSTLPEVEALVRLVEDQGSRPDCTIIGHSIRASVINAALANGGMAHGDEVDPVHSTSVGGHVAAGPVPTALTAGEWLDASGEEVLRAVVLGYEVGGRLMTIFYRERDYVERRFYHTAIAANLSSAVTAALLLKLDRQQLQVALCLAAYQAAGPDNMTRDPGHMGKTFQVGAANRNGVTAALLARKGCFAPLDILDGSHSVFDAYLGHPEGGAELLQNLGSYFSIMDVMHKRYSAGTPNQAYLQGLFKLMGEHRLRADDIAEIEIHMPKRGVHRVPTTRHASISSLKVCAVAAATGGLDFNLLHGPVEKVDAVIATMAERIKFVGREDWTGMEQGRHAIVNIRTHDGRYLNEELWHQPMDRLALESKFRELTTPRYGAVQVGVIEKLLAALDGAASVRPLMDALRA
jgi:2-methylcitrate dehydratase PrpD